MKPIDIDKFVATTKHKIKDYESSYHGDLEKEQGKIELEKIKLKMDEMQEKLYASGTHSLLVIFQAMDAAGKDSAIEHVMSGLNPQGCQVRSFKTPNSEELKHDFLWRHYKALPERGQIGIHNRSHYENVLVCKVHPEYVLSEHIPGINEVKDIKNSFWKDRYESIRGFEKHLTDNGTSIIKIFLNVSKEEQKKRFLDRIDEPSKNWKFAGGDLEERLVWDKYMSAYEDVFAETSTKNAPWYVVPADKKWYARLVISEIILTHLKAMDLRFPELPKVELDSLAEAKTQLLAEK